MNRKSLCALLVLGISFWANADDLFQECDKVIAQKGYKYLQEYLSINKKEGHFCQRLNDYEILFTDDRNVYYCHINSDRKFVCEEHDSGAWFPSPTIASRFVGENGKKYVLFKTARLAQGVFDEGYQVFYLTPKTSSERGYVILNLNHAGVINGLSSDAGEICSNMGSHAASIPIGNGFEIVNESRSNVTIRFTKEITSCATNEKSKETLDFTWQNGKFEKVTDEKE